MDPVVQVYLTWGTIAAAVAVFAYFSLGMRPEHERLGPPARAAAAVVIAIIIVVVGPPRGRYSFRKRGSMASHQLADAKKVSARDQAVRDAAFAMLKKAEGSRDVTMGIALGHEGNKLHTRGWSKDAVTLYRRAYEILVANGAGNGDWRTDSYLNLFLANFIADLQAEGESMEAGKMRAVLSTMRTRHGAAKVP